MALFHLLQLTKLLRLRKSPDTSWMVYNAGKAKKTQDWMGRYRVPLLAFRVLKTIFKHGGHEKEFTMDNGDKPLAWPGSALAFCQWPDWTIAEYNDALSQSLCLARQPTAQL